MSPTEPADAPAPPPQSGADRYAQRVLAWLERHKRFPNEFVRDRFDATVLIAFSVDRRGRVRDVRIVRESGIDWLDALALRQVRAASPFPRPPEAARSEPLTFEVPMRYRARS
ncbi:TonB family protein [Sphingosinithalassobacter sp. CS137]|uniref:TonB family protein n=1 Tax=Sphingosinithalassobacter sp. CS137 TaxID=2762748 RepID=UPI00165E3964|nr:TonB family protein [Sphingosinithalassobacter sp. CS137]